ncbi:hypothetical protein [Chitinimonas taiwanensis]|uniref:Uncharacterized protein n=1 Tax=Chitinimonas taiwanensis DSM 18899 TaxID=1121279 RepID=A0A1K2HQM8_9NEIS|nr:hypothetical protein [Chitinimonas taiwanensis]SFZ79054.1 hypothetical protein SAMN02745887_03350 [Chitinimonas taiwanensis DSM 18899]
MPSIADYIQEPQKALIDAATEPSLRRFIDSSDLELVTITLGDGTQAQVQALAHGSVRRVVERIISEGRRAGVNIQEWICSPSEFNLCTKLNTPVGQRMRELDAFLNNKWTQGAINAAGLITLFTLPAVGVCLTLLSAIGFVNNVFIELCECPVPDA